jgi:non-ribosomal peptide synthetase component F
MFSMQNGRQHTLELPGITIQALEPQPVEASACDLAVSVRESPQGLDGLCIYRRALFDASTITQLLEDYHRIIDCLIAQPELPLSTFRSLWNP